METENKRMRKKGYRINRERRVDLQPFIKGTEPELYMRNAALWTYTLEPFKWVDLNNERLKVLKDYE